MDTNHNGSLDVEEFMYLRAEFLSSQEAAYIEVEERRQRMVDLFHAMDTDLGGMLDAEKLMNLRAEVLSSQEAADIEVEERRQRMVDLFYAMDTDLNGMLDVEEFREAMRKAKHELSGSMVSKVLDSMDVHGRLTLEEFLAIADVSSPPCAPRKQLQRGMRNYKWQFRRLYITHRVVAWSQEVFEIYAHAWRPTCKDFRQSRCKPTFSQAQTERSSGPKIFATGLSVGQSLSPVAATPLSAAHHNKAQDTATCGTKTMMAHADALCL